MAYAGIVLCFSLGLVGARLLGVGGAIVAAVILLVLVIPLLCLAPSFVLFPQVVALEKRSGVEAIRRVWQLTSGARMRLALLAAMFVAFSAIMVLMFQGIKLYSETIGFFVAVSAGLFVSAYFLVVQSLEYMQLRTEKESYDLELLAAAIESGA